MAISLKFAPKYQLVLYTILSMVSALSNIVVAYVTKIILNDAQKHQGSIGQIIMVAALGIVAPLIIMLSNFVYNNLKFTIIKNVNVHLKSKVLSYLVEHSNESKKDSLSLMTNDLKQIETLKTLTELTIISYAIAFLIAFITGLINSWLLTIIFMVTSLVPGLIQRPFTKGIQKKPGIWQNKNAEYTEKVSDGLNGANMAKLYDVQKPVMGRIIASAGQMEGALKSLNYTQAALGEIIFAAA